MVSEMRLKLSMILMLGLPAVAAAQPVAYVHAIGSVPPLPPIGLPLPQIGLPLPQIGLPLPPMGLPPVAAPGRPSGAIHPVPRTRRPHPLVVYVIPAFGWPLYQTPTTDVRRRPLDDSSKAPQSQPSVGHLELDIEPNDAQQQLYVDSDYVGTFKGFSGGVELEAGPHTIEIKAPGYETLNIDVNISPGRSITYRGTLTATGPRSASGPALPTSPSTAPVTPTIIYSVPGCYLGNVPPQDAGLPASCDVRRVITSQR